MQYSDLLSKDFIKLSSYNRDIEGLADAVGAGNFIIAEYYGYSSSGTINGAPDNSNGILQIMKINSSFCVITAYSFSGKMYTKVKKGGTYTDWSLC